MLRHKRTQGQALVEFALAATLIFFLLAAIAGVALVITIVMTDVKARKKSDM